MSSASFFKKYVRGLVQLSYNEQSIICEKRVRVILDIIGEKSSEKQLQILKEYLKSLQIAFEKEHSVLEYTGLTPSDGFLSIRNFLNKYYKRNIEFESIENPDLIAGFKLKVGDDVWEYSVRNLLKQLIF